MEIKTTTPLGETITVSEEPGGVYGSRLKFTITGQEKEFCTCFEMYLKDFKKIARCFLGKIKRGK